MRQQKKFALSIPSARPIARLSGICVLAMSLGACGSDMSRFGTNPFSNPFASNTAARDPASTGSIGSAAKTAQAGAARQSFGPQAAGQVQSAPLGAPQAVSPAMANAGMTTGSINNASPAAALRSSAQTAQPAAARLAPVAGGAAGWTAQGGTPVVLAHGETVDTLSGRYGVPAAAILSANGLSSASQASPGSKVVIPVYNVEAARQPGQRLAANSTVASDADIARPQRQQAAPVADAKKPAETKGMTASEMRAASEAKTKQAREAREKTEATAKAKADTRLKADAEAKAKVDAKAEAEAAKRQKVAALPTEPEPKTTSSVAKEAETSKGEFRWPARGRIINGFSGKGGNEGINIAVPEGTPVKAAEGGVVAYSGSELKGYGNLVLIRHDNGYVSAYAHNGELNVKRGDKVGRGQVIAKSGQSGNVSSPQLHFELRKGSNPVDPTPYLTN